jgi:carboxymethylenebutenolidase
MQSPPSDTAGCGEPVSLRLAGQGTDAFDAWHVAPASPNGCAVVVLQEIFGVTRKIRGYCGLLARHGYVALAPDLFWRMERGVELSYSEDDIAKARGFLARFDDEAALGDIAACCRHLRGQGARRVALVGFCLGGKLGPLALARHGADAAVAFYGVGLERHLDELRALERPVQFHFGQNDAHIPQSTVAAIEDLSARKPNFSVHRYENAGHAFFRPDLKDAASQQACERMLLFLDAMRRCE